MVHKPRCLAATGRRCKGGRMNRVRKPIKAVKGGVRHHAKLRSHVPGRLRIRLSPESRKQAVLGHLKKQLSAEKSVHDVVLNHTTGSVKIVYDHRQLDKEGMLKVLEDLGVVMITLVAEEEGGGGDSASFAGAIEDLTARLSGFFGSGIELKTIVPLAFLGLGLWAIARNGLRFDRIPGWLFLWVAYDMYTKLHTSRS